MNTEFMERSAGMYDKTSVEDARELFRWFRENREAVRKITQKSDGSPGESRIRTDVIFRDRTLLAVIGTYGADDITLIPGRLQGSGGDTPFTRIHPEGAAATEYFDLMQIWQEGQ